MRFSRNAAAKTSMSVFRKDNRIESSLCNHYKNKILARKRPDSRKTEVCKFFLQGSCTKPNCSYSHISRSNRFSVCQEFLQNKFCPRGSNCLFRHITNASKKNHDLPSQPTNTQRIQSFKLTRNLNISPKFAKADSKSAKEKKSCVTGNTNTSESSDLIVHLEKSKAHPKNESSNNSNCFLLLDVTKNEDNDGLESSLIDSPMSLLDDILDSKTHSILPDFIRR